MRSMKPLPHLLGVVAALLLIGGTAGAQEFRATVTGRVTDSAGLPMPGATVSATNTQTNEVASAVSNPDGAYSLPFLRPGVYKLSAELQGFRKHEQQIQLEVGQSQTLNITLQVGAVTETVTVTSEAPQLETEKADRGMVIDQKRIAELPLQARNPFSLSVLVAGVNYNAQAIYLRPFDNGALADWSMNGGANRNNEFLLDGAPNNANQGGNNIAYVPPAEAVQEFKIATNSYDAQYGRTAGGVVNVSLKSGTNTFHGVGYEFFRRKALDSNSFHLNSRNQDKVDHYLDQYGFSIDGPVMIPKLYNGRNKTFFLFAGERYREGTPNALFGTTPTEAMRNGDFSNYRDLAGNLIPIFDPATGRLQNGVWVRDQFPGNIIPAERINPVARQLISYYPLPNNVTAGVASWQQNLAYPEHINKDEFWNWVAKVDHNFTQNDRMFFRWAENERNEIRNTTPTRSGPAQDGQLPLIRSNRAVVGDWVHVFNGGTVFNVRTGYTYYLELSRSDSSFGFDATSLGLPASFVNQLPFDMFPRVEATDYINLSRGFGENRNFIWSIQPNISMVRGRHNIRGGLDARYTHVESRNFGNVGGQFNFTRSFTQREFNRNDAGSGSSIASMLLGAPSGGNVPTNVLPDFRWTFIAPWVQDDWKVTDKWTVNAGFRWDFNSPVSEDENRLNYAFDPTIVNPVTSLIDQSRFPGYQVRGGVTFVGQDGNPETPWEYDKNNAQVRFGTTYQLNEKTVLRGGYGMYYLNPTGQGSQQGFSRNTDLIASLDGNRTPTFALGNPFPLGVIPPSGSSLGPLTNMGRADFGSSNPNFEVPYVHQFSVGVQRELPWGMVLEASYVGSRSRAQQDEFRGVNEPSRELLDRCDVTRGGSRSFCDEQLPNPFFGVPGFEGTSRFTSPTLSRFDLSRPFPQYGAMFEFERNDGRIDYDSAQFVLNKRWSKGLTLNATYTWVPRFDVVGSTSGTLPNPSGSALNGFIDNSTRVLNESPYFTHRDHRFTASGVWEFPWGQNTEGLLGLLVKGWSVAPMFVYQSGQPWLLPGNVEIVGDPTLEVQKTGQFIYGAQPCVGQRQANGSYALLAYSQAYGCTQPFFLIREPFQARELMFWDDRFRRPSYWQLDLNFAKTTPITDRVRFQVRVEAFNVFNSPMYDERDYERDTNSDNFGRINRNTVSQSNFQRFIQLGFRLTF